MTLEQLDAIGRALRDLQEAVSYYEHVCTPDGQGKSDQKLIEQAARTLDRTHQAWNRAVETARPFVPAPSRPRGWTNMSSSGGCQ
jgi:hypothetical protein